MTTVDEPDGQALVTIEARTAAHAAELLAVRAHAAPYELLDEAPAGIGRSAPPQAGTQRIAQVARRRRGRVERRGTRRRGPRGRLRSDDDHGRSRSRRGLRHRPRISGPRHRARAVAQTLEVVERDFGATRFLLVAERRDLRSLHLAECLGFREAADEAARGRRIAPTEILLRRDAVPRPVPASGSST